MQHPTFRMAFHKPAWTDKTGPGTPGPVLPLSKVDKLCFPNRNNCQRRCILLTGLFVWPQPQCDDFPPLQRHPDLILTKIFARYLCQIGGVYPALCPDDGLRRFPGIP